MFSDSATVFWGSACLIWDSALRAWHSHLSWAAKPEQVATSWHARGNFLPVLLLPFRFLMTLLSWEKCGGALVAQTQNKQLHAINKSGLFCWILREFRWSFSISKKLELYLSGLTLIFLGCDHGMETFTLSCAEFCSGCPNLALPLRWQCLHPIIFLSGKGPWHPHPHSWEQKPEHELLHWVNHRLNQQFMWWGEHRGRKLHF